MKNSKDKLVSCRINSEQLARIAKALGVDESKAIRASLNCTENVLRNFFGGEVTHIFKRKRSDEELDLYENP